MPNTLVHIALQLPANRFVSGRISVGWILLGLVIPDIPWVMRRMIAAAISDSDPFILMQYATVQATLLFCLLLSLAIALLARRSLMIAIVLAVNCTLHLLLDALEIKPGNGVHLFAPLSWEMVHFELIRPNHPAVIAFTGVGFVVGIWLLMSEPRKCEIYTDQRRWRIALSGTALIVYFIAPLPMLGGPLEADNHSLKTLQDVDQRVGKIVRLDRQRYYADEGGDYVITFTGEKIWLDGPVLKKSGRASIDGQFIAADRIHVSQVLSSSVYFRGGASVAGLIIVLLVWLRSLHASNT